MKISGFIHEKIMSMYGIVPPECGGIIGGKDEIITEYYHDFTTSDINSAVYEPNAEELNRVIHNWSERGISFYGMVHSHPENEKMLSEDDISYIKELMCSLTDGTKLYFPIVFPKQTIVPYGVLLKNGLITIVEEKLEIV